MTAPWVTVDPACGRSDCQRPASVVRTWRSGSGKLWNTRVCAEHEVEPDAALQLPGFRFVSEEPARPISGTGPQDPSQVG